MKLQREFENVFKARAVKRLRPCVKMLKRLDITDFYLGGNSLNKDSPNDIDIYPILYGKTIHDLVDRLDEDEIICLTENALTIKSDPPIQLCSHNKRSLHDLIESFDFSHIQIGVKARIDDDFHVKIDELYMTDNFIIAHSIGRTFYTGSEYPISSLMRVCKYKQQGAFEGASYIMEIVKIMNDILSRGVKDWGDFKKQLSAICKSDVLSEEIEDTNEDLVKLFRLLKNRTDIKKSEAESDFYEPVVEV